MSDANGDLDKAIKSQESAIEFANDRQKPRLKPLLEELKDKKSGKEKVTIRTPQTKRRRRRTTARKSDFGFMTSTWVFGYNGGTDVPRLPASIGPIPPTETVASPAAKNPVQHATRRTVGAAGLSARLIFVGAFSGILLSMNRRRVFRFGR